MKSKNINRREFLRKTVEGSLALSSISFLGGQAPAFCRMNRKKVIVLGIDGMDQNLLRLFVRRGGMPAFKSFMENHHWGPLQTTTPPQSPVAWSSFITGSNPGVHGIFDFVQRDVTTLSPFMSISRSFPADKKLTLGSWSIPLETGSVQLLRKGTPFWSVLEEQNIPVSLFQLPANFPVQGGNTVQLSGLGTPDLLGTYGTFTYYTDAVVPGADTISGGRVVPVQFTGHEMHAFLWPGLK
jgi:predicted AlkP superfamily pyrophosphatase or phosphodiesterase